MTLSTESPQSWLDRPVFPRLKLNVELLLYALILLLAFASRFYILGERVMSHDENTHVIFSWDLYKGFGYKHDPLSHGPFQFHIVALSYFLFGDDDFTARLPHALFSIATVAFAWFYRRYLGRSGALIAAVLLLISPFMLYYGRYARNETWVAFSGIVFLWAALRYLETGKDRFILVVTLAFALHFTAKETAFIYAAQALVFLGVLLLVDVLRKTWPRPEYTRFFLILIILALSLVALFIGFNALTGTPAASVAVDPAAPAAQPVESRGFGVATLFLLAGLLALAAAAAFLVLGYGWKRLCQLRSFDLLILIGTLVLPMLAAFPVELLGINPIDYASSRTIIADLIFVVLFSVIAIAFGLAWKRRLWLINAGIFYAIFTVLYTTIFTNGFGFITGLVGSLGYWLEQHGENRGSQPWYYYGLVQVPVYEFLPALASLLALFFFPWKKAIAWRPRLSEYSNPSAAGPEYDALTGMTPADDAEVLEIEPAVETEEAPLQDESEPADPAGGYAPPVVPLLGFWSISSLIAFSIAGEKMPWLTVHITLGMILLAGWVLGRLINSVDWSFVARPRGYLPLILVPVFMLAALATSGSLLGAKPPFQGQELVQLEATTTFLSALVMAIGSGAALFYLLKGWTFTQLWRISLTTVFALLAVLTARTAITANYINYDQANELLVYAHSARGPKQVLKQVEEISERTAGDLDIAIAYDNETNYPYWWYLRNYPNKRFYNNAPTRDLRDAPVIVVGDVNYSKIEPVVGNAYEKFETIRLWWPNQDYWDLTWDRLWFAITDRQMRNAVFQIWLNRDYTEYGKVTGKDLRLTNWYPSARMRLYVRKDIVARIWNYGTIPSSEPVVADPYEGKKLTLQADRVLGATGVEAGQFERPRDLAVAPDGSLYVADTGNHRIQHLSPNGEVLQVWGSFADAATGAAPGGSFNEPWGLAVGPDGSVYVADTWNHRVQKFTADGEFIKTWGYFGQAEAPEAFWGPRDVAVDADGNVFVTDTGNKRIAIFDADGGFITQFGETGLLPGQFDEPVGVAVDSEGRVYVTDTWNQRLQVFAPGEGGVYTPLNNWEIVGWFGKSLDNKPYLAVSPDNRLFVTDPEGARVLEFTTSGEFVRYWGDFSAGTDGFGMAGAAAYDGAGGVWVSDVTNGRIMHFLLPTP